eukprot:1160137-Pelagomonas_calceolata.AAC.7
MDKHMHSSTMTFTSTMHSSAMTFPGPLEHSRRMQGPEEITAHAAVLPVAHRHHSKQQSHSTTANSSMQAPQQTTEP